MQGSEDASSTGASTKRTVHGARVVASQIDALGPE